MPRKASDVEKSLIKKGFRHKSGDHNYFCYLTISGKKTLVKTKTSHGCRELSESLLGRMCKQVKLTRSEFSLLIDCPLGRLAYEEKLRNSGVILE
jgi:hypothetical protein